MKYLSGNQIVNGRWVGGWGKKHKKQLSQGEGCFGGMKEFIDTQKQVTREGKGKEEKRGCHIPGVTCKNLYSLKKKNPAEYRSQKQIYNGTCGNQNV